MKKSFPAPHRRLRDSRLVLFAGLLLLLGSRRPAVAQAPLASSYEAQKSIVISTVRFPETKAAMLRFIRLRATRLQKQEETPEQLVAEFSLPLAAVPALDSLVGTFGYVQANNLNRQNLDPRLTQLETEEQDEARRLQYLQEQLRLELLKTAPDVTKTRELQSSIENTEGQLRRQRTELHNYNTRIGQAYVLLRLFDEISFPVANRKVNFVNMPGVEFGFLHLDNPVPGFSAASYQGYSVKYLFTRGKSYFNLGIYKPVQRNENPTDSSFINEINIINFGQDFYPRNFGRGKKRFFNLYTSYQVGGFITNRNDDRRNNFIPNLNLGLGVELVKTKHVLLDTKASYFLPINSRSRDMRGLLGQVAFNFVF